jgi:hypothetical protein
VLGAQGLGEFGDEPDRHANAKSRKNYAGTSPITRASGTKRVVLARYFRNHRLADAILPVGVRDAHRLARRPELLMTPAVPLVTPTTPPWGHRSEKKLPEAA